LQATPLPACLALPRLHTPWPNALAKLRRGPASLQVNWSSDKKRLYEFVVRHFLACCSREAVGQETLVRIDIAGEEFRTTGG
jgi:DNA topoisomerase IA